MSKTNFTDADVIAVASRMDGLSSGTPDSNNSVFEQSAAIKVIDSVLSLGINYYTVVYPRLKDFESNHPDVKQITELSHLMAGYSTPIDFLSQEFNYKHKGKSIMKANAINSIVEYLCKIINESLTVPEEESLRQWAIKARPRDCYELDIKGFKIAGFQWLRMLFGADTSKPDVHIKRFLHDTLNRELSDIDSVLIMEAAASHLKISVRDIDHLIWEMMAKWRPVRLAPDVAEAFPTDRSVNEALRSLLKSKK